MIDDTAAERRATIDALTEQIVAASARLTDHIQAHPGELLLTAAYVGTLREQLKLRHHLRRSQLVEVQ